MTTKRGAKARRRRKIKDLRVKGTTARKAGSVKGGKPGVFELKDFSFGVENPTTIGSATGGTAPGKVSFNGLNIKKP